MNLIRIDPSFNGWCNDGVTISGSVTVSGQVDISGPTPVLLALNFSFTVLTVSDGTDLKARLTALSSTQFRVEVDADGNNAYETTVGLVDWTSL